MAQKEVKVGMKPSHPGVFIRDEVIDELGLSVSKAAEILGVRRATLSDLLNKKSSLTPEMGCVWRKAFHLNMDMLLRMQAWYDATEMRKHAGKIKVDPHMTA